ncbi:hypothetical protein AMAG_16984 [Allomyces macrogynus ATCC 38327]|uniref:Major facilitator superfamily (MFS) profile domain-containing protein n=1 Tax=Allomyces macrogynus (strain ATCC 38327) TaxID=578462 RepID=A0A0L0TDB8_ALLM3|nr:hypothetical protein AMAG_16984 [Allomyces macrogynus ATCC 38327]|eukprot:KNE72539.1 hypothetical protein AMAG_16984 [Allomyces macrogynus ATCC 38327]
MRLPSPSRAADTKAQAAHARDTSSSSSSSSSANDAAALAISAAPVPAPAPTTTLHRRVLGFIYLHPAFSTTHFLAFLAATFFTVAFFVYMSSATAFVLSEILGLKEGQGNAAGSLAFYDELLSMLMVVVWGVLSDRVGRRAIYTIGFLLMGAGMLVYPLARNLYPQLLLARLLYALGGAACSCMLTAVLADCAGKLRGRISGLVGLVSGLGALLGVFVFLPLPAWLETKFSIPLGRGVQDAFFSTGVLAIVFAGLFWVTASRSFATTTTTTTTSPTSAAAAPAQRSWLAQAKLGITAARDWRVAAAYAAGFAARGNTVIVTLFVPLWVNQYYITNGLCAVTGLDPNDEAAVKTSCRAAFTRASVVLGVVQTFALIGAPLWGLLMDRFATTDVDVCDEEEVPALSATSPLLPTPPAPSSRRRRARTRYSTIPLLATCVVAGLGYLLLFLTSDPRQGSVFPIALLVGFGEIGTVITSVAMVAAGYVDSSARGAVAGVYSLSGAAGILAATKLGGVLFDAWTATAPFLLMAGVHVVVAGVAAVGVVVEARRARREAESRREVVTPVSSPEPARQ